MKLADTVKGAIARDTTQGIQRDFDSQSEADVWADEQAAVLRRECLQEDVDEERVRRWGR